MSAAPVSEQTRGLIRLGAAGAIAFLIAAVGVTVLAQQPSAPPVPFIGPNVNMVAGPTFLRLPGPGEPLENLVIQGDPLQNPNGFEMSCAMSARNPLHFMCFANDNRVVDVLGVDDGSAIEGNGDSTIGVFQSIDGGGSWSSTVHPTFFPKPLGYDYAADPAVASAAAGMFHSVGLVSNRGEKPLSAIYHSAWIDLNDQEGDRYPAKFLYTSIVDIGSAQRFMDRPTVLVSPPRPNGPTCTFDVDRGNGKIVRQTVPASPIHAFWVIFQGSGNNKISQIWTASSVNDCGRTWTNAYKMSEEIGLSQGIQVAQMKGTQNICAAWRKGTDPQVPEGISVACSTDGGMTYAKGKVAAPVCPVDWGTTPYRFRTRTSPTIAADTERFYVAFSERPRDALGACVADSDRSRITLTTSTTGTNWSTPTIVDSTNTAPGFQLFPQMTFNGKHLNLAWFDSRHDVSGVFGSTINERDVVGRTRHSIDVFGAVASLGASPAWTLPFKVSKYTFGARSDGTRRQLNFNFPNLRLFAKMMQPGLGDFIAATSEQFVPRDPIGAPGAWTANLGQLGDAHVWTGWADNRNVRTRSGEVYEVLINGTVQQVPRDWAPPALPSTGATAGQSIYDSSLTRPACAANFTGMRNQDPYGALWTQGSSIGATANNRPMLPNGNPRSMSVFAHNLSNTDKLYQFRIFNQPPGGTASFNRSLAPLSTVEAFAAPSTAVTRAAFVTSTSNRPPIRIDVYEIPLRAVSVSNLCVIDANGNCTTTAGTTVKGIATAAHGFSSGDEITIVGADPSSYSGTFVVTVIDSTTFNYTLGAPVTIPAAVGSPQPVATAKIAIRGPNTARFARTVWFNADPTEPAILEVPPTILPDDPAYHVNQREVYGIQFGTVAENTNSSPTVTNPGNWTNPGWEEPGWEEAGWTAPGWEEPGWEEPGWEEPGWEEPGWEEPGWEEPGWEEPGWEEAGWETSSVTGSQLSNVTIKDVRFPIRSKGNTAQVVKLSSLLNAAALNGLKFQLVVYRVSTTAGPNNCDTTRPTFTGNKQVLVNIDRANVSYGKFTPQQSTSIETATLHLLPRETLWANLRMFDPNGGNSLPPTDSILLHGQQNALGTNEPGTTPPSVVSALAVLETFRPPVGFTGNPYAFQFQAVGGGQVCSPATLPYSWSALNLADKGLALSTTGQVSGTPTAGGPYTINVTANECPPRTDTAPFNLILVHLPAPITAEATSPTGATVGYTTSVSNATDGPLNVNCTPPADSTFSLFPLDAAGGKGHTSTVTCTAADQVGNSGTGTFPVTVVDTTPPVLQTPVAVPTTIWAGGSKKISVTVSGGPGAITDSASGVVSPASFRVEDEYNLDEPSGPVTVNANGSYSFTVLLTANRNNTDRDGRTYQIFVSATDRANNVGTSAPAIVTATP